MNKMYQDDAKCPEIENLEEITPEQAMQYVRFVSHVRHTQRRYFSFRRSDILDESKRLEKELDALNAKLLDTNLKLF